MNIYAGVARSQKSNRNPDVDTNYFRKLAEQFPSSFSQKQNFSSSFFSLIGTFESAMTADEQMQLFFTGEINNRDEIASLIHSSVLNFQNKAHLLLAFFLEKGIEQVKQINGQFIIIYFDIRQQNISIVSDHLGIQQLFYYQDKNIFLFGSEIKFLLAHPGCPKEIDWETSLRRPHPHIVLSSFKSYRTWFREIFLMPEGSILEIDLSTGKTKTTKYWGEFNNGSLFYKDDNRSAQQVMEEYIALLEDAVKIRISEDATGYSFLSGGLDSSVICALAAKYKPLETFSIITQTTCLEDTTSICNQLAHDLNFKNSQFLVPFHELTFNTELWKQRIWRAESPVNHTDSLTKTLLHYAIRKKHPGIKSLLTGTGSDQLNGGLVRWVVEDSETKEASWENFSHEIIDAENRKFINRTDDGLWAMRKFINRDFLASVSGQTIEKNPWIIYVNSALHIESYSLLWDEIRAASTHGHTMHFPFLDFRFVEFISKIPLRLHKELFYDKPVLREPAKKFLPDYVINKLKAPASLNEYDFRFRLYHFLTSENNGALIKEALGEPDKPHPVINKKALMNRIEQLQKEPEIMEWIYIMQIINLGLLEQLPGKSESDLNYEYSLEEPIEVSFDNPSETKIFLENRLAIKSTDDFLKQPLLFAGGCSFMMDTLNNKYYLSKKNILTYEIDEEYTDWKNFLEKIDNKRSTKQILNELNLNFERIEEFFRLSFKEQILTTGENHPPD